jgi:hypothetical protein
VAGETEVRGENLSQFRSVTTDSNAGCCGGKPAINHLSYSRNWENDNIVSCLQGDSTHNMIRNTTQRLLQVHKQTLSRRMVSSGLLHRVALVITDVSEERGASIRVTKIGELGTTQAATAARNTKLSLGISSQRTSVASCSLCCS